MLQLFFNNVVNAVINKSSNQLTLKFKFKKMLIAVTAQKFSITLNTKHFVKNKFVFKQKTTNIILFATIKSKIRYNVRY